VVGDAVREAVGEAVVGEAVVGEMVVETLSISYGSSDICTIDHPS
jgi:hypothetical protein